MNDRQRLEAIVSVVCKYLPPDGISKDQAMTEIISLVDPLPEQEHVGEPVGEMQLSAIYEGMVVPVVSVELPVGTKLYTTPYVPTGRQQRPSRSDIKPLTDERIDEIYFKSDLDIERQYNQLYAFVRAIEAAHGITSETDFKE